MPRVRGGLISALLLLSVVAGATGSVAQRQHVTVSVSNYRLQAPGLQRVHAGFATITIHNNGAGEHGLNILRLRRPLTHKQIGARLSENNLKDFDARGGVAVVPTGGSWEGTIELVPGRYAIVDGAVNGGKPNYARGMLETFNVEPAASGARRRPPSARS